MLQYVWACRNILQHPEQQRHRGSGSPPADAPARPCGFPRMPLGMRSWREGASGVRGCPGKLHRSVTKTAPRIGAVFVTRDASLAICLNRTPFAASPAGFHTGDAARRASTTGAATRPGTSPARPPASPTTHRAPSRKREQQAPASPCDRYALAPLGRIRRTSDAVRAGQPRAPGRPPPRSRAEGRADGNRARLRTARAGGDPGPLVCHGYDFGTTASK